MDKLDAIFVAIGEKCFIKGSRFSLATACAAVTCRCCCAATHGLARLTALCAAPMPSFPCRRRRRPDCGHRGVRAGAEAAREDHWSGAHRQAVLRHTVSAQHLFCS
jgi:hypothetical protein